jgi:hypothetical protein
MTLVQRPDLSTRTVLSKSAIASADWCQTRAWYDIHERRQTIPTERLVFGSCLDAAVEQLMAAARASLPMEEARPLLAAEEVMGRDGIDIDLSEIARGCETFVRDVMPRYDFALAGLQVALHEDIAGVGETSGHPDVRLRDGSIFDVKSAKKAKFATDAATSTELGLYALLSEAERGALTPRVGYWTWVRTAKPYWQVLEAPVTDEMRRRTRAVASAYVRARAADELLNRGQEHPVNFTLTGGPKFAALCGDCAYSPAAGGPCQLAVQEEGTDA